MIELDATVEEATDEERIPVFSIDGIVYDMPAKIKTHLALKYLWMLKQQGSDYATAWLMETVLGKEGFKALSEYEALTPKQFSAIKDIVQKAAMGATEEPGKDPSTASRYSGSAQKKSRGRSTTSKT